VLSPEQGEKGALGYKERKYVTAISCKYEKDA
jgi:hypothetical protein